MFKLNDPKVRRLLWHLGMATFATAAVLAVNVAWSGAPDDEGTIVQAKARIAKPAPEREGFRLRCWQHGRLLFEEFISEVPASFTSQAMAMPTGDTPHGAVYLMNSPGAMCLVRPAEGAPSHSHLLMPES
jgi:hypothetical protein